MGLLKFLKWKKGRRIVKKKIIQNSNGSGGYEITVKGKDNNVIVITEPVLKLMSNPKVRSATRRVLSPLNEDGIDEFQVRQGKVVQFSANKDEVKSGHYDVDEDEVGSVIEPQYFDAWLTLRAPVFEIDRKWQFYYGEQRISAVLKDADFVKNVFENGSRFGVGDKFKVHLSLAQIL